MAQLTARERQEWITAGICPDCGEYMTLWTDGLYRIGQPCYHVFEYRWLPHWTRTTRLGRGLCAVLTGISTLVRGVVALFAGPLLIYVGVAAYIRLFPPTCADGWRSPSIGHQGACSYHGGVTSPVGPLLLLLGILAAGFGVMVLVRNRAAMATALTQYVRKLRKREPAAPPRQQTRQPVPGA
jgi:hypothetical protein